MHNLSYCVLCLWEVTFFQTWICMAMIFEPYLDCYSSIFSPNSVCRSWDYGLSTKWSPIFNRMSGTWLNFQFVLLKHITLICQHDKLPLVEIVFVFTIFKLFSSFCMNFGTVISQEQNQQSCWNFYSIFVIIRNRQVKLFSVITQPWRHPGAILCFDVIIDIFISVYHKLTKFNTHKLQVIWQHTDNPCPRARHCARVKILTCSKSPINNFEHEPGHLEHFQIFRPYVSARALCARAARMNGRNSKFSHDLDSWYNNWRFPLIFSHSWPFIRPCERVKV